MLSELPSVVACLLNCTEQGANAVLKSLYSPEAIFAFADTGAARKTPIDRVVAYLLFTESNRALSGISWSSRLLSKRERALYSAHKKLFEGGSRLMAQVAATPADHEIYGLFLMSAQSRFLGHMRSTMQEDCCRLTRRWSARVRDKVPSSSSRRAWALTSTVSSHSMSQRAPRVINISDPSFRSLFLQLRFNGQVLGTATGFVVESARGPLLITNRHNVTGRHQETNQSLSKTGGIPNEFADFYNSEQGLGQWVPKIESLFDGDIPRWIEHPTLGATADFVALPLSELLGAKRSDKLDPAAAKIVVGPADTLSVVWLPIWHRAGGYFAVWATGFVASEPEIDFRGLPTFLIDCRNARPGQSGSAVIAYRHSGVVAQESGITFGSGPVSSLLGIYSGRINGESDIGFVWKIAALRELVAAIPAASAS